MVAEVTRTCLDALSDEPILQALTEGGIRKDDLDMTLLKWPHPPAPWNNMDDTGDKRTLYGLVYMGRLYSRRIIVKRTKHMTLEANRKVDHEVKMADKFHQITPRLVLLGPHSEKPTQKVFLQVAFDAMETDLYEMMKNGLDIDSNVPMELARILSQFEIQEYLLRDFRLEKFMANPGNFISE